jgi:hypothetical protein
MAKASDSDATGTARAAALREQIEKMKGCGAGGSGGPADSTKDGLAKDDPAKEGPAAPLSQRELVRQRMNELDKKRNS